MTKAAYLVTFSPLSTGQIQILRTGKGFWRWDHGAPFAIDETLIAQILRNTQLRARPIRVDFMHWANGDMGEGLSELAKAGEVDPCAIFMSPWPDPATGSPEFGLFCPVSWTHLGASAAYDLDEISPVIEWEYALPFDVSDPLTGEVIKAGTNLGPTITGISLVDQGFFWMDKVRVYSSKTPSLPNLYQERTMLSPEKLAAFIIWAQGEGWPEEEINQFVAAATAAATTPTPPAAPEMAAAGDATAAAEVMAARQALVAACTTNNPAAIIAANKAYAAAVAKTKKPTAAGHPLNQLLAAAKAAKPRPAAAPATTIAAAPTANASGLAAIEEELAAQRAITTQLLMDKLDREGLLAGIEDPMELYTAAPEYFQKRVNQNISLLNTQSPAGANRSGLREIKAAAGGDNDEERVHRAVSAYRAEQVKAGRKTITYEQALLEWEEANPRPKKVVL